ncbi:hypothetical protein DPEC_G00216650 [Dallia pectoralis]|uniref:Uncharacterized protein n=1 Tax=Dallia pectoralis TaxID=75939 RepID=A0ACC2G2U9_DALPE|nr:hypothetical protein DPEC_G00216650 [Dallia pectoralis]
MEGTCRPHVVYPLRYVSPQAGSALGGQRDKVFPSLGVATFSCTRLLHARLAVTDALRSYMSCSDSLNSAMVVWLALLPPLAFSAFSLSSLTRVGWRNDLGRSGAEFQSSTSSPRSRWFVLSIALICTQYWLCEEILLSP